MRWNFISDTILFSIWAKTASYLEGHLLGFGTILFERPPFAHVRPKGCLPGPRKKERKKHFWRFFSVVFWSLPALLLLLAPELWRRGWSNCIKSPGVSWKERAWDFQVLSMKFNVGNMLGTAVMKEFWRGKVTKKLQSLKIYLEPDHLSPPPPPPGSHTNLSLLDYHLSIVLPTQPMDTNTLCAGPQQSFAFTTQSPLVTSLLNSLRYLPSHSEKRRLEEHNLINCFTSSPATLSLFPLLDPHCLLAQAGQARLRALALSIPSAWNVLPSNMRMALPLTFSVCSNAALLLRPLLTTCYTCNPILPFISKRPPLLFSTQHLAHFNELHNLLIWLIGYVPPLNASSWKPGLLFVLFTFGFSVDGAWYILGTW